MFMQCRRWTFVLALGTLSSSAFGQFCTSNSNCNDNNQCTVDVCIGAPFGTCINTNASSGTPCGSTATTDCTLPDACNGSGTCLVNHRPNGTVCTDDTNPCTNDLCSNGTCTHSAKPNGTACPDDLNQCTNDVCTSATCMHPPKPAGTACGDGNSCTSNDVCNGAGACAGTPIPDCAGCPLSSLFRGENTGDRILDDLRDYRDQVLSRSVSGRNYVNLYYIHADEVSDLIRNSADLQRQTTLAVLRLLPFVEDVLVGKQVVMSRDDARVLDRLLETFQQQASDDLAQALDDLRDQLAKGGDMQTLGFEVAPQIRTRTRR